MFLSRAAYLAATVTLSAVATSALAQDTPAPKPAPASPSVPAPQPATRPVPVQAMPKPPATPPAVKLPAGVAARVNGKDITYSELAGKMQSWSGRPILQQVVQARVIEQEAKKYGVTVTPAELKAEVAKVKQEQVDRQTQSGGGMMTWSAIAARDGISDGYVADNVRLGLLARKTYQKVIESSVPSLAGQIKVAHILIPTVDLEAPKPDAKPKTPEEVAKRDADAKAQAEKLIADINAKTITFEDAAKQFSADKGQNGQGSAANGGALPYTGKGRWDPAFEAAAFKLEKPGDITPTPVKSQYGYHLIKLLQKGDNAPAAEKAAYKKELVDQQLQNPQGIGQWIQYMMSNAKINYDVVASAPASKPAPKMSAGPKK